MTAALPRGRQSTAAPAQEGSLSLACPCTHKHTRAEKKEETTPCRVGSGLQGATPRRGARSRVTEQGQLGSPQASGRLSGARPLPGAAVCSVQSVGLNWQATDPCDALSKCLL